MNPTEQNAITEYGPSGFHNDRGEPIMVPSALKFVEHRMGRTGPIAVYRDRSYGDIVLPVREVPA